jgi:Rps23 Pro-64 3,4-dihydroxylase Tpa1-like proline 4-hydroxylase
MNTQAPGVTGEDPPVRLDPRIKPEAVREVFRRGGRLHLPGIFPAEVASRIHRALVAETPWTLHFNEGESRHLDLPVADYEALDDASRRAFLAPLHARARAGFQYLYENFAISDLHPAGQYAQSYLMRVYEFMRSPAFLQFARALTGLDEIVTLDMQATRYRAGHFLTAHDDGVEGKGRLAAYVLNFTTGWRADCGGILQFIDHDGHVAEGLVPTFNALNVFRVPSLHAVSAVAPFVTAPRLSLTGWLRKL